MTRAALIATGLFVGAAITAPTMAALALVAALALHTLARSIGRGVRRFAHLGDV